VHETTENQYVYILFSAYLQLKEKNMKLVKSFLPFLLIIIIKLCIDLTYFPHETIYHLFKSIVYFYVPYIVVILFGILYFRKFKRFKLILIISSILVFLNIVLAYGPLFMHIVFYTTSGFVIEFERFSIIFSILFALIALIYSINSKNNIAIIFAFISISIAIYVEIMYIPNLDYNPYEEFKSLIHFGLYRSIGRSILSMILISLSVFTGFFSLLKSE